MIAERDASGATGVDNVVDIELFSIARRERRERQERAQHLDDVRSLYETALDQYKGLNAEWHHALDALPGVHQSPSYEPLPDVGAACVKWERQVRYLPFEHGATTVMQPTGVELRAVVGPTDNVGSGTLWEALEALTLPDVETTEDGTVVDNRLLKERWAWPLVRSCIRYVTANLEVDGDIRLGDPNYTVHPPEFPEWGQIEELITTEGVAGARAACRDRYDAQMTTTGRIMNTLMVGADPDYAG